MLDDRGTELICCVGTIKFARSSVYEVGIGPDPIAGQLTEPGFDNR